MLKTKIFQKIGIGIAVLTVSFTSISLAMAAYQPKARNLCALSVHPFNASASGSNILGPYDSTWYNIFNQGTANCDQHLQYPKQYLPQDPLKKDNPLVNKTGIESKSAPVTQHNHAYYNDSVQDNNVDQTKNFYYKSFIDKFQLTLKEDALKNTDKAKLVCMTPTTGAPVELVGCNGHINQFGGTNISFDKNTGVITWEFGVDSTPKKGRPVIYGKNPGLNWVPDMPNTTIDDNRAFEPAVKLISNDNKKLQNKDLWSATTVSRVLLRDTAILQTSVNTTGPNYGNLLNVEGCLNDGKANSSYDYTRWCTLPTPTSNTINGVEGSQVVDGKSYYWFRIGVVGTTWQTPLESAPNKCTDLKLTWTPNSNKLSPDSPVTFHVEPSFSNPTVIPLQYKWQAVPGNNNGKIINQVNGNLNNGNTGSGAIPTPGSASNSAAGSVNNGNTGSGAIPNPGIPAQPNFQIQGQFSQQLNTPNLNPGGPVSAPKLNVFGQTNLIAATTNINNSSSNIPAGQININVNPITDPNSGSNKFADSSSATDFGNPYTDDDRDTYYTGGPGGTHITVQAIDPLGGDTSACKASVDIPPSPPELPVCTSLTLTPKTVNIGKNDYSAVVKYSDGKSYNTEVTWTQIKGSFTGGKSSTVDVHQSATPFLNSFTTSDATASVTAKVTNVVGAKNSAVCTATVTGQPILPVCLQLNASPTGSTLPVGVATVISADPVNVDNSKPDKIVWSETGNGVFKNVPGTSPACAQAVAGVITQPASANTTFTSPANCKYTFTAATGSILTLEANPNTGNVAACKKVYTVGIPGQACLNLKINNPNIQNGVLYFTPGQSINEIFNLNVEKSGDVPLDYHWTETPVSGSFDGKQSPYTDIDTSTLYVNTNPKDGTKINVQAFAVGVAPLPQELCQDSVTLKTKSIPGAVCDDTKFTLNSSSGNTLTVNQPTTLLASGKRTDNTDVTEMTWTTTSGLLTPFGTCTGQTSGQNLTLPATCPVIFSGGPKGTIVSVSAVPPESGNICKRNITVVEQPTNVCTELTIIPYGNNNYCVQTKPGEFSNQVVWSFPGGNYDLYNNNQCIHLQSTPPNSILSASVPNQPQCQKQITFPPSGQECQNLTVTRNNNTYCAQTSPGVYTVVWNFSGTNNLQTSSNGNQQCAQIVGTPTPGSTLRADVPGSAVCHYQTSFEAIPPSPPTIEKDVKFLSSGTYTKVLNLSHNSEKRVQYRLRFTPTGVTTTTLTDTISGGQINGEYPNLFVREPNTPNPGRLEYRDNMTVEGNGIHQCNTTQLDTESNCYTGDILNGLKLIKVSSLVTITYQGEIVNSSITQESCNSGYVCQEIYTNLVKAPYILYDSQGNELICQMGPTGSTSCQITSNEVRIQIFCQYILTRAAGDVYLEQDLNSGIDIYKCTNYKSTTGVLVSPAPDITPIINVTGSGETVTIGHEVCSKGQAGTLPDELKNLYGNDTSKLSSQICEVKLRPGSSWQKSAITNTIEENKTRISRWEPNVPVGTIANSISGLYNSFSSSNGVYHIKGDLTVDPNSTDFTQDGDGANTIIVEDGDLIIKNNITINSSCSKTVCTIRDTASLAFIVLNGNIYVDKDVTELSGVFFVQQGEANTGKLISGLKGQSPVDSDKRLTVLGSIYGDIQPLFEHRFAAGDPSLAEGTTVIRTDARIFLNTPPGLQDLVDIKESEVAR